MTFGDVLGGLSKDRSRCAGRKLIVQRHCERLTCFAPAFLSDTSEFRVASAGRDDLESELSQR